MKFKLAVLAMSALLSTAIGSTVHAQTPSDTMVIANAVDGMTSFDPAEVFEFINGETINNVYLRLVVRDENDFANIVGGAAESWTVSDDGLTFTFKMREGLVFASGAPVTAKDAAFSLQRVVKLAKTPAFILTQFGLTADNVDEKIKAVDDGTLAFVVDKPYAPTLVLNALSAGIGSIVEEAVAMSHEKDGDLGYDWLRSNSAGAGAYVLREWVPQQVIVIEGNDKYFQGPPATHRIIQRHVPEATTQRLMLEKGDVDITRLLGSEQLEALSSDPNITIDIAEKATILYLGLNQKMKELADPKVKEAIRWLVDYEGIADALLKRQDRAHQGVVAKGGFASFTDLPYSLDVEKAKALLAEAGYPNGFKLELDVYAASPYREIGEALQANFAEAGIELSIVASDRRQALTKYRARNHQAALMIWSPDYGDPHSTIDFFVTNPDNSDESTTKTAAWRNTWSDAELQKIASDAVFEQDADKREAMYLEIQRKLQTESPMITLFQQTEAVAMRNNVTNWISGPAFDTYVFRKLAK